MTVGEVRQRLATASPPERDRLLGKILREARDPDVWRFVRPEEVAARFSTLSRHLGRRRPFWEFLLDRWHKEGYLSESQLSPMQEEILAAFFRRKQRFYLAGGGALAGFLI